jgi:hypothetical protein
MTTKIEKESVKRADGWLIHKQGRGWYRPNAQGYTAHPHEAGRYSYADAMAYSHPNGLDGPRDGITIKHESDLPQPKPDLRDEEIRTLRAALDAAEARLSECQKVVAEYYAKINAAEAEKRAAVAAAYEVIEKAVLNRLEEMRNTPCGFESVLPWQANGVQEALFIIRGLAAAIREEGG